MPIDRNTEFRTAKVGYNRAGDVLIDFEPEKADGSYVGLTVDDAERLAVALATTCAIVRAQRLAQQQEES
jgi:hypothetical protein